ncbi:MAG TPA: DMT family transporter [Gaiellaceae bacterium]|nr:DMT family transporter [Gaiellaceae bacterium]
MSLRAHLALLAVVTVWAGSFSVIKALLEDGVAAGDIALWRYAIAAPGFALVLRLAGGLPGLTRGDALRAAVAGLLVVAGYHLFLNAGTEHTTSGVAALVVALAPGMTVLLSALAGLERLGLRRAVGLGIAFAGVAVVVGLGSDERLAVENVKGPLIVLGAPVSFALYNVLLKPLLGRYDLLSLTAATSLVGTLGLLPFVRGSTLDVASEASARTIALLLYLGVLATLLGYVAWNLGLRGLGPGRAVTYAYAIPPLAVGFGALALDEPLTAWTAVGAGLVLGGIAVAQGLALRGRFAHVAVWRSASSRNAC